MPTVFRRVRALLRQGSFILAALPLSVTAAPVIPPGHADAGAQALTVLAADPYWHRLLRDPSPDDTRYRSQADRSDFFLSSQGAQDAGAELEATLAAFAGPWTGKADDHPACRFPARHRWLAQRLPEAAAQWPLADCPELKTWLEALDTAQVTLVFASDYLNNPSSMFGHTLLRLDARTQTDDNRLLAYAINYSAQTNTSNGLEFAWKGLTGGYPGAFSLLPYYEKVKEYNDWESRDLWEYELALTQDETDALILAYWEWRQLTAPYYFLSRNCSYELLGLIEMARPGLRLQEQFPVQAIPTDTLRAVLDQPGLLRRVTWRAASGTRQRVAVERNAPAVNRAALALMQAPDSPVLATLTPEQQGQALETAYDDLYSRYIAREVPKADTPETLRQLLVMRSRVPVPDQRVTPARPVVDPAGGHGTSRWGVAVGHDHEDFAVLRIRPAYHDWLDASGGYRDGARIDFLDINLRADRDGLGIEEATLVGIDSLAPANGLRQPLSWAVRFGIDRALPDRRARHDNPRRHAMTVLEGGAGLSLRAGQALCYGQSHSDLRGGGGLDKGWEAGTGARIGCTGGIAALSASPGHEPRWLIEQRSLYRLPSSAWAHELRTGLQLPLGGEQALRLEFRREWREDSLSVLSLGWLRYF